MRIVVDVDRCDSNGLCTAVAPELFELDDDESLRFAAEPLERAQWRIAENAAQACPKLAITLVAGD